MLFPDTDLEGSPILKEKAAAVPLLPPPFARLSDLLTAGSIKPELCRVPAIKLPPQLQSDEVRASSDQTCQAVETDNRH
jgi:hypothetical protein